MSRELKWDQREIKAGRHPSDRNIDAGQLYIQRRINSHSRPKFRHQKHVNAYQKELERRRELENKRLLRRISDIHKRKSSLGEREDERQKRLYTLNMVARKCQREKQQQNLQQQNDIIVQRIVRMRSYNGPLSLIPQELTKSQAKRKDSNRSLLLPKIQEYDVDI